MTSRIIEVDQSGKIEQTRLDTVVALSNEYQYAVLLPKSLKKKIIRKYRKERQIILKLFVVCLYYLLKDYLKTDCVIIIDNEYEGKQNYIKSSLLQIIRQKIPDFDKSLLKIMHVTKQSKAHKVAVDVIRGHSKPQMRLTGKHIMSLLFRKNDQGAHKSKPASTTFFPKVDVDLRGTLHKFHLVEKIFKTYGR
jgi:hypothetical protein